MKPYKIILALALTLAAGLGAWAWRRQHAITAAAAVAQCWVCPMRCLNGKTYGHPGRCPVCHMELNPIKPKQGRLLGYKCPLHYSNSVFDKPGRCPFCTLELSAVYEGTGRATKQAHVEAWQRVGGKTAVYFRAYTVAKVQVDRLLRVAGTLSKDGRWLSAHLPAGEPVPAVGSSAMMMPALGYSRPVLGAVQKASEDRLVIATASQNLRGLGTASAEIRLSQPAVLAIPLEAVTEEGPDARVFVRSGEGSAEAYSPRAVKLGHRGESYVEVTNGLALGDVVAASGVFWMDAQWRMDHPEAVAP